MKRLLTAALLSLVCCAANAKDEKVISIVCKGSQTVEVNHMSPPDPKSDLKDSRDITTVYSFRVEKNPTNYDALEWSMQRNEEQTQYQQYKPRESFHIWVTDQLISVLWQYKNDSDFRDGRMTVNRFTGNWLVTTDHSNKKTFSTDRIIGTCEAAKPKF